MLLRNYRQIPGKTQIQHWPKLKIEIRLDCQVGARLTEKHNALADREDHAESVKSSANQ